jgi:hypothetical protein
LHMPKTPQTDPQHRLHVVAPCVTFASPAIGQLRGYFGLNVQNASEMLN